MAKKVGILFGMEDTFPWAFIDKVNELGKGEIIAEPVKIDVLEQGADYGYAVIIDRISQDVPFYRAYLKNAALNGTYVINNPFWWSADEKFFNNALNLEFLYRRQFCYHPMTDQPIQAKHRSGILLFHITGNTFLIMLVSLLI